MSERHHVYFVPGLFGFGRLAGYDYFTHMRHGLEARFKARGISVAFEDVPSPPTSSLRERARVLATTVSRTASPNGVIHLVGHSTGGLDARLVVAQNTNLHLNPELMAWTPRVRSVISLNTPHYGTPLASYFATVSGTRVLYAISLLTVISLKLGEPSLAIFSRLLAGLSSIDSLLGGDLKVFRSATGVLLRFVDKDGRGEITDFLSKVRTDQGAVIQTTPEAMDLFNAVADDNNEVRYGCVATAAPRPRSMRFAWRVRSPYTALTAALYTTWYQFAGQRHKQYDYARLTESEELALRGGVGYPVSDADSDGVVPTLSMIWGKLLWAGEADHLDVIGHFYDRLKPSGHTDWLTSGSAFDRRKFAEVLDAIAKFQLADS
jgi:pimeloyl-ACP methyl ester carboxylesterase